MSSPAGRKARPIRRGERRYLSVNTGAVVTITVEQMANTNPPAKIVISTAGRRRHLKGVMRSDTEMLGREFVVESKGVDDGEMRKERRGSCVRLRRMVPFPAMRRRVSGRTRIVRRRRALLSAKRNQKIQWKPPPELARMPPRMGEMNVSIRILLIELTSSDFSEVVAMSLIIAAPVEH